MNKQGRLKQKIEKEPNQLVRTVLMIQYICEYCSTEQKNSLEKFLMRRAGYPTCSSDKK